MTTRSATKSARLIALALEIDRETFDPDTVNMNDLAVALDVNRSTIMRDLRAVEPVMELVSVMRRRIRDGAIGESMRRD